MNVKAFAVDVDGTMTEDHGRINLEAAFTLRWLTEMGDKVILVSGRSAWEAYALAAYVGLTRVVVGENGGVVATSPVDVAVLADRSNSLMAYDRLAQELSGVRLRPTFPRFASVLLERTFDLDLGRRTLARSGLPVAINDSGYAYHLDHRGVNKAEGLRVALRCFALSPDEVVAVGDGDTDIPLFEACGYSVALANASDSAKAKAKHVTRLKRGEGLVEAVRHVVKEFKSVKLPHGP